tara:strand:- start:924 stop:2315 length:1392 start_codon:yes stop_codon:yes gene_type:complete
MIERYYNIHNEISNEVTVSDEEEFEEDEKSENNSLHKSECNSMPEEYNNSDLYQEEIKEVNDFEDDLSNDLSNDLNFDDVNFVLNRDKNNRKHTFLDVKYYVDDFFNSSIVYKYSCALDILGSYLKGQKILYNESKNLYFYYLNCLMIPCIILSSLSTVLSQTKFGGLFDKYHNFILCVINAIITCLLTCLNYLKLDAGSESFKICATQYEKLEKEIVFTSGETLLFSHPCLDDTNLHKNKQIFEKLNLINPVLSSTEKKRNLYTFYKQYYKKFNYEELKLIDELKNKIKDIKKKIIEIDETNKFTIPKKIQNQFLNIYSINIFTIIKKIEDYKSKLIMKLKYVKNQIHYFTNHNTDTMEKGLCPKNNCKEKIDSLFNEKYKIIEEILYLKTSFLIIDNIFQQEIKNNYLQKKYFFRFILIHTFSDCFPKCFICTLYPKDYVDPKEINPSIYKILFEPYTQKK